MGKGGKGGSKGSAGEDEEVLCLVVMLKAKKNGERWRLGVWWTGTGWGARHGTEPLDCQFKGACLKLCVV